MQMPGFFLAVHPRMAWIYRGMATPPWEATGEPV